MVLALATYMNTITLNNSGKQILLDEDDYEKFKHISWSAQPSNRSEVWYAQGWLDGYPVMLHRVIMGLSLFDKKSVDHINNNGLDNRKCNLRLCNYKQNQYNQVKRKPIEGRQHCSVYKGVCKHKERVKWRATFRYKGLLCNLMVSSFEEECAYAYNIAATLLAKEFASINKDVELLLTPEQRSKVENLVRQYLRRKKLIA